MTNPGLKVSVVLLSRYYKYLKHWKHYRLSSIMTNDMRGRGQFFPQVENLRLLFLHHIDSHKLTNVSLLKITFAINILHELCNARSRPTRAGRQNWAERSYRCHSSISVATRTDVTKTFLIECSRSLFNIII